MEAFGPVISEYTVEDAVEDGDLVKVEDAALLASLNIKGNVYITIGLWGDVEHAEPDLTAQNMHALLGAASYAFRRGDPEDLMRTDIRYVRSDGRPITVWGVIDGAGVTLMTPSEY